MKKYFLALFFMVFLVGLIILNIFNQQNDHQKDGIDFEQLKLYKGFPVFPPESIETIEGEDDFSLEVRGRKELLERLENTNKMGFPLTVIRARSITEDMDKKISEARNYIHEATEVTGWVLEETRSYLDGGSIYYRFILPEEEVIKVVHLTSFAGGVLKSLGHISVDEDWGILNYSYSEVPK